IKSIQKVDFCSEYRAFNNRWEVDAYLHLQQCREELEQGHTLSELVPKVPFRPYSNPWLERRRSRLLFKMAREYERKGQWKHALKRYAASRHPEARTRQIRVLELA